MNRLLIMDETGESEHDLSAEVESYDYAYDCAHEQSELQIALRVRRALLQFRDDILASVPTSITGRERSGLWKYVRYARQRIERLFGSDVYGCLRSPDCIKLRDLHVRLHPLGEFGLGSDEIARTALSDLRAFAEALIAINHRGVLVEYDRELLQRGLEGLTDAWQSTQRHTPADGGWNRYRDLLENLREVGCRDDKLGMHVAAELKRGHDGRKVTPRVARTMMRLSTVSI